jgi:hypothetical protein
MKVKINYKVFSQMGKVYHSQSFLKKNYKWCILGSKKLTFKERMNKGKTEISDQH